MTTPSPITLAIVLIGAGVFLMGLARFVEALRPREWEIKNRTFWRK